VTEPLQNLLRDLRHGARSLARTPGFTVLAAATLALGIGANTAIFSVVDAVLLRPLPFRDPARLVTIWEDYSNDARSVVSAPEIAAYRDRARSLEAVAAVQQVTFGIRGGGADPELVRGALASPALFPILGVTPAVGRLLLDEEDRAGSAQAVLLTHELWQRRFGGDPSVVGRAVAMDVSSGFGPRLERPSSWTIAGILPPRFELPVLDEGVDVWAPLALGPESAADDNHYLFAVGRLRPGAEPGAAVRELRVLSVQTHPDNPSHQGGRGRVDLVPLEEVVTGEVRPALLVLLGAVGFVLLVACANVAHLVLARASGRRRELAVRAALGARPRRLVRELLAESVLLAAAGGAAGLLLAAAGVDLLVAIGPEDLPRLEEVRLDPRAGAFTAGVSLLTALLFGLVPALRASRPDLDAVLRSGGRAAALEPGATGVRAGLVVAEVAVALLLLVGAGLLLESFLRMRAVDPGFRAGGALTMHVSLPRSRYGTPERAGAFTETLLERVRALPGVTAAGTTSILPLSGWNSAMSVLAVEDREPFGPEDQPDVSWRNASAEYHEAMGTRLLRGRPFSAADFAWPGDSPAVVLVNEAAAAEFWPGADPVGKFIELPIGDGEGADQARRLAVAGVVEDMLDVGPRQPTPAMVYFPGARGREFDLVVRTAGDPLALAPAVRRAVLALDPDQPVSQVEPLAARVARATADTRFQATLVGVFAALAASLAAIGVYGVVAWVVSRRTAEIGVRMALGAERRDVVRQVLGGTLRLVGAGVAVGVIGAAALGRALSSLLYGVEPHDPAILGAVACLVAAVGAAAGGIPALRAARLDPVRALRED
jgi:predicted permease